MAEAVDRCRLDLSGTTVLTEAASGAYVITPVLAALAGAERVFALTRSTHYGTAEEIRALTLELATVGRVEDKLSFFTEKRPEIFAQADIVTNSGHVRPITAEMVGWMKPGAVIPIMYEAWEFRAQDVDFEACRRRGIRLAGTNERHSSVDVFSYLGTMAVKLILDAGVSVYKGDLLVLCDNPFAPHIEKGLRGAGGNVRMASSLSEAMADPASPDAIIVALRPRPHAVIGPEEAAVIAARWPGAVLLQYWGDVDRAALRSHGVPFWPEETPGPAHMGILPSAVGPEPIVRLQAGGLKVGEILLRGRGDEGFIDAL
jgi:hypothetical protein